MRRVAVILAFVLPLAGAAAFEWFRRHGGVERAFIFLVALALSVTLAIMAKGGDDYPQPVRDLAATSPEPAGAFTGCAWPAILAMLFVAGGFLLLVITICGRRF